MAFDQKQAIDYLITNCDCWDEHDREVLQAFNEEKLKTMKSDVEKSKNQEAVVNAAREGFEDQQGNQHVFNEETGKWEVKKKEPETPTDNKGSNDKEKSEPLTEEQWMAQAPPAVRSAVANAQRIVQQEKDEIVEKLTTNLEGDAKERHVKRLEKKGIEELRLDLEAFGPKEPTYNRQPNYAGASTPVGNTFSDDDDLEELPLPFMTFGGE